MAKNVLILGAGVSAQYSAPTMPKFLDASNRLYRNGLIPVGARSDSFRRVFDALAQLRLVHSKADLDLKNIEAILTTFELARILGRLPGAETEDAIDQIIDDLKWVIVETIEGTLSYPDRHPSSQRDFYRFCAEIFRSSSNTAVITFNYDLLIETGLYYAQVGADYEIAKDPNYGVHVPLLKMHGSLNWTKRDDSSQILPLFLSDYIERSGMESPPNRILRGYHRTADLLSSVKNGEGVPMIVPPSWNKTQNYQSISAIWKRAAKELSEATSIYIIGYSLPETDAFFRQFFALGTAGNSWIENVCVVNTDKSREGVFKAMMGSETKSRFKFFPDTFENSLHTLTRMILAP